MPDDASRELPEAGLLSAAEMLAWRSKDGARLPEAAILTNQGWLLSRKLPFRRRPASPFSFEHQRIDDGVMLVACRGVGAPGTAIALEEMAVAGVTRVIALNIGGSIDPEVQGGDVVVIEIALAGDGTSKHYSSSEAVEADRTLTEILRANLTARHIPHQAGIVYTTDAVYRESARLLGDARQRGAVMVDMETVATFAVSRALGLQAAAVLVAADQITDRWQPPESIEAVKAVLRSLLPTMAASLKHP